MIPRIRVSLIGFPLSRTGKILTGVVLTPIMPSVLLAGS
jgi:hypothetical protein